MVGEIVDVNDRVELTGAVLLDDSSFPGNKEDGTLILLERMLKTEDAKGYILSRTVYEKGKAHDRKKHRFSSYHDLAFSVVPFSNMFLSEEMGTLSGLLFFYEQFLLKKNEGYPVVTSVVFDENLGLLDSRVIARFSEDCRISDVEAALVQNSVTGTRAVRVHMDYELSNKEKEGKKKSQLVIARSFPELRGLWISSLVGTWNSLERTDRDILPTPSRDTLCALWLPYNGK